MADRFFTADPLTIGDYVLQGPEAHHLAGVRRFGPGDRVTLFNGNGSEYLADVVSISKKNVVLHIASHQVAQRELPFTLVVAAVLPKGDRADFLIEKLTEIGVTKFIPLITNRAVVRPRDSVMEKFQRAVIEASKQCGRNQLMSVDSPCLLEDLIKRMDLPSTRYFLHTEGKPFQSKQAGVNAVAAIGPEGGFTPEELEKAKREGWQSICLGPRVLRVETAAVAAATLLSCATHGP